MCSSLLIPASAEPVSEVPNTTSATAMTSACAKCGVMRKSGKRSCCVSGGAWFKQCGNPGDAKFEHTWSEGIRACKAYHDSVKGGEEGQMMLKNVSKQARGISYRGENISTYEIVASMSAVPKYSASGCNDRVKLAEITLLLCLFVISFHVQVLLNIEH